MGECIERIREYAAGDRSRFEASRLVQDAVEAQPADAHQIEPTPVR
jgi:hypothetical protein